MSENISVSIIPANYFSVPQNILYVHSCMKIIITQWIRFLQDFLLRHYFPSYILQNRLTYSCWKMHIVIYGIPPSPQSD
jgi:hypothetical protein